MHHDHEVLIETLVKIHDFLELRLQLILHPDKVFLKTASAGVDFLGWVNFPTHRVLRTTTKKRMFKRLRETGMKPWVVESYLGLLGHGNTYKIRDKLLNIYYNSFNKI